MSFIEGRKLPYESDSQNYLNPLYLLFVGIYVTAASFLSAAHPYSNTYFSYFVMIGLSSSLALLAQNASDRRISYILLFLAISVVWLPFSLRGNMGLDDPAYLKIFKEVGDMGWTKFFFKSTMEPGYLLLNSICQWFTSDYSFCRFVCATIPFVFFYLTLTKLKDNLYYFFAVLYIVASPFFIIFNAALVRIFIAISIVFYSYRYFIEQDLRKYVTCILIAMLFHYSAGIMLAFVILFIRNGKFADRPLLTSAIIGLSFIVMIVFLKFMVANFMGQRYQMYLIGDSENKLNWMSFDTLPFVIYGLFARKEIPEEHRRPYNSFLVVLTMGSVISIMSTIMPLGRTVFYFNLAIVFLVSYWYKYSKDSVIRFCVAFVFIFYCFLYAYLGKIATANTRGFALYPYIGYFSDIIN